MFGLTRFDSHYCAWFHFIFTKYEMNISSVYIIISICIATMSANDNPDALLAKTSGPDMYTKIQRERERLRIQKKQKAEQKRSSEIVKDLFS